MVLTASGDGTVRVYRCEICGTLKELVAVARRRLAALAGPLSPADRRRFLP